MATGKENFSAIFSCAKWPHSRVRLICTKTPTQKQVITHRPLTDLDLPNPDQLYIPKLANRQNTATRRQRSSRLPNPPRSAQNQRICQIRHHLFSTFDLQIKYTFWKLLIYIKIVTSNDTNPDEEPERYLIRESKKNLEEEI